MSIAVPVKKSEDSDDRTGFFETLKLSWVYTVADARRRPLNIIIGITAVMLLVFFSAVVFIGIWKTPYILLRLAELTVGEMDIILYGGGSSLLLNYTKLSQSLAKSQVVAGAAPRWIARADLTSEATYRANMHNPASARTANRVTSANILLINSELEQRAGIGRGWPYREIGFDEAQIFFSAASYIGVSGNKGERVHLSINASSLRNAIGIGIPSFNITRPQKVTGPISFYLAAFFALNNITEDSIPLFDVVSLSMAATMADAVETTAGKYSSALGNVVVMDCRQFLNVLVDQSCLLGPQSISPSEGYYFPTTAELFNISLPSTNSFDIQDYAMMVVVMLEGRYDMYYANTKQRGAMLTEKANKLMEAIGLSFDGNLQFPLDTTIQTLDVFRMLMTAACVVVVIGIVVLGLILMFTLLQINAEERQFELAMIRAQGMSRTQIIGILVMQTLAFTVPGTAVGVLLACATNAILERMLSNFTKVPARLGDVPITAIVIGILMGLLLPLVATYSPVKRALSSSLRDALDIYRQVYNEAHVKAIRLEAMGLRMWQILLGLFLVFAGFLVYYLMPLSFIFSNMMMFFILLDFVLICMIAGLCMMTYVVQGPAEVFVLYLLLWGRETRLQTLIRKNLRSHRDRNSKAYMMVLLSVACLVASGMMFSMMSTISSQLAELTTGAPVTVVSKSFWNPLDQASLDAFMRGEGSLYAMQWAYTSFALREYPQIASRTQVGSLIGNFRTIDVRAVTEFFMDATYPDFNMVNSYRSGYEYPINTFHQRDVIRSMYEDPPHCNVSKKQDIIVNGFPYGVKIPNVTAKESQVIPMIISSAAQDMIGLDVNSAAQLRFDYFLNNSVQALSTVFYLEPRALVNRISGFLAVSSLPILFSQGTILVPTKHFQSLLNPAVLDFDADQMIFITNHSVLEVRQAVLYVQLRSNVTKHEREIFVNALQAHTNTFYHVIVDTEATVEQLRSVQTLIMGFFYFTSVICITLCAFMMWTTFISNVQLNAWTFGVLRSLGFRTAQLMRCAVYESLCIVISAFTWGLVVGTAVGVTMAIELCQIMVIPFHFNFPYALVIIVFGMALAAAVVGSIAPLLSLRKKPISSVLRGI
ncbi:permease-like protein [Leishmania major strain Friedlin]|uniref:Permease-like protein n=1 Tax=Leishmania major TaxID=5664 RepID=Q4QBC9_LEIMA|nr:permease-like protein [Leishmania major strain Friedlin]CAG9574162.1 permease-like_protein [Leishmania major strain Friedlin]CAJ04121.1 permease-like protein [Leishmania major strain Friedlin]|eukprot:XP_001683369.1 permease-like protein [Leishmania major strain Friedlin]